MKISGVDRSIIWRLGGIKSDFILNGFNFSSQHHARFRGGNSSVTLLSLFDNASDDYNRQPNSAETSSGKLIALYTDEYPMTARLIQQWERPDGGLTDKRGSIQFLDNGNVFLGFAERGYVTEFTADGRLLFEGKFVGPRQGSYRGYKYNFTGTPDDSPIMKTLVYRLPRGDAASVHYVSWNGATEVKTWIFYGSQDKYTGYQLLGEAKKTGFETVFTTDAYSEWTYVEAVAADGTILGRSEVEEARLVQAQNSGPGFNPVLPSASGSLAIPPPPTPSKSVGTVFASPTKSSTSLLKPTNTVLGASDSHKTVDDDTTLTKPEQNTATSTLAAIQASSNGTSLFGPNSALKEVGTKSVLTGLAGMLVFFGSFASGWFAHKYKDRCREARKSSTKGEYAKVEEQPLVADES
jgi:hypothetical protein